MTAAGWKGIPAFALNEAGVREELDGLIAIPYRLPDGRLYSQRVVATSGRRWWRPGDGRPTLPFGLDRLEDARFRSYRVLAVTEGESDALALFAALGHLGFDVLGLPGAGMWRAEWRRYVVDPGGAYAAVYVIGDGDDAGRRMTQAVLGDVPEATGVWLPEGKDVRSVIQGQGIAALLELIDEADQLAAFGSGELPFLNLAAA